MKWLHFKNMWIRLQREAILSYDDYREENIYGFKRAIQYVQPRSIFWGMNSSYIYTGLYKSIFNCALIKLKLSEWNEMIRLYGREPEKVFKWQEEGF